MANFENKPKVTLEDLLRLKQAERPTADFWMNFERELRQKQLSALVEKRSWWQALPRALLSRRVYLPVGATAILTFTLVSMRLYSPNAMAPAVAFPNPGSSQPTGEAVSDFVAANAQPVSRPEAIAVMANPAAEVIAPETVAVPARVPAPVVVAAQPLPAESPSARSIAANFARLQQNEPELINSVLGARLSSPARVQTASAQPSVELASLAAGTSKRIRLVAHYNDRHVSPEPAASEDYRERLIRRLDDTGINERLSRIGLKGDQFSLKF